MKSWSRVLQTYFCFMQARLPNGKYIPVAYGLLPDKTTHTYSKFLGILAQATPEMFTGKLLLFS